MPCMYIYKCTYVCMYGHIHKEETDNSRKTNDKIRPYMDMSKYQ